MATFKLAMAVARRNPVRIPRRDFAIVMGEDLRFKVKILDADAPDAAQISATMRLVIWPDGMRLNCDYGWASLPRSHDIRQYRGVVGADGHSLLRVSGRATVNLCGRHGIAILTRNSALSIGVLQVASTELVDEFEPGLFTLDHSALDGPDVLPARVVGGQPVDADGFLYVG